MRGSTIKRVAGLALLLLLLGGLCLLLFSGKPEQLQTIRRPDGSTITLVDVTYGTNHTAVWGKSYQRSLYKMLPQKFKGLSGASVARFTTSQTNVPVFWLHDSRPWTNISFIPGKFIGSSRTIATGPARYAVPSRPVRAVDEFGCEYEPQGWSMGNSSTRAGGEVSYYQIMTGDPHGKIVGICVYDSEAKTNKLGTFLIHGASPRPMPAVKPQALSAAQDGEMDFQLTSFITGLKSEPYAYGQKTNGIVYSQAAFHISKNGTNALEWFPYSIKISDAKGKNIPTHAGYGRAYKDGDEVMNFEGALDPADGPFKLHVEYLHQSDFSPDELVTFKDVPFPGPSETVTTNLSAKAQGQEVTLENIYGPLADRPGSFQPGNPMIQIAINPGSNGVHLQPVTIVDETGTELGRMGGTRRKNGKEFYFGLGPKSHARTMTLIFAVHQSRFVEFEAMPTVLSTNQLAKK